MTMAEADTEADTMEAAFTVKAVQAVENIDLSRRSRGSNSDSDSDGGDSDFSIDDHNLPWEITEKLLLNENSDIELVQSRGASTVSLWPPPGTRRTRQRQKSGGASTMSQSRSSVFSVAPLTPTPQTIFRGQQIAEEEKEYERMKNMLTKLKYRSKNIRKRVELPVTEASLSSGGSSHGGGDIHHSLGSEFGSITLAVDHSDHGLGNFFVLDHSVDKSFLCSLHSFDYGIEHVFLLELSKF